MSDEVSLRRQNHQLNRFCRQYLQLLPNLDYPDEEYLRKETFQESLHERLFKENALKFPPPKRYQLRVLKELTKRIENSIQNWEEDGISDNLMNQLSFLMSTPLPSEVMAAQQQSYATYTLSSLSTSTLSHTPTITLLESPSLLSGSGTTGLRTWEAALHLSTYLTHYPSLISHKTILELGCGTGFVSILCAKYLNANHVLATDGSPETLTALNTSLFLNSLTPDPPEQTNTKEKITIMELPWGHLLPTDELSSFPELLTFKSHTTSLDLVLAADVIYSPETIPSLIATFDDLFDLYPDVEILVSSTIRNPETYGGFVKICERKGWEMERVEWKVRDREDMDGPWYGYSGVREGIEILWIRRGRKG